MDFNRNDSSALSLNFNIPRRGNRKPGNPQQSPVREPIDGVDPDVAARYLVRLPEWKAGGVSRLRYWGNSWWWWQNGCYSLLSDTHAEALILEQLKKRYTAIRDSHIRNVVTHLRAALIVPLGVGGGERSHPCWLSSSSWKPSDCLATADAIVHLPSLIDGASPASIPATPTYFSSVATRCKFDPSAPEPREWLSFLSQLWPDDPESIEALQIWFGYCLTPDTSQQKIMLLVGPKRGGKGTIGRILSQVVGEGNVAAPTYASFAGDFALECLLGKSLAIIGDVRIGGRSDRSPFVERLLTISGEDRITVNRKYKAPFDTKLPIRFMLLTNESPRLDDASATIVSRFIVLRLKKSFYNQEDTGLEDRLTAELPGILNWAIDGWKKLRQRGRFAQPASGTELVDEMNALASPLTAFVDECCIVGQEQTIECSELFRQWREWCQVQGYGEAVAGSMVKFGRDLRSIVPELERQRRKGDGGGDRPWEYRGIGWQTPF